MKTRNSFFVAAALCALSSSAAFAFDWPQEQTASDSFFSYFGQLRGGTISSSLIFKDNSEIKAAYEGRVTAVITDHGDDFGWFESTLGNAVTVAHKDNLVTVYANLDDESIPEKLYETKNVESGEKLGVSGNSGWQEGQSCLEFKVIDTKNATVINPRILMPRVGKELPLAVGTLTMDGKDGKSHNLTWERYIPAGVYSLYRKRQSVAVPYRTSVAINGATVESISYDTLKESAGLLCATGNSNYSAQELYPDAERQLLAIIQLTHGRNTVSVTVTNILGTATSVTYALDVY